MDNGWKHIDEWLEERDQDDDAEAQLRRLIEGEAQVAADLKDVPHQDRRG